MLIRQYKIIELRVHGYYDTDGRSALFICGQKYFLKVSFHNMISHSDKHLYTQALHALLIKFFIYILLKTIFVY